MSWLWVAAAFAGAAGGALIAARRALGDPAPDELTENHRGVRVPVVLGRVAVNASTWAAALALAMALLAGPVGEWRVPIAALIGGVILSWVGRLDDRSPALERGLGAHVRSLLRGRVTTGIAKLVAGVAVAVAVALYIDGGPTRFVLAVPFVALSINVTNALDVRPGRALKWGCVLLVAAGTILWMRDHGMSLVVAAYLGAGLAVLPFDLRERAMLGDAGSNPLGLVVGAGLATALPDAGLAIALALFLGLQVAAETVTISRLIEATPPLRWLDALGRSA